LTGLAIGIIGLLDWIKVSKEKVENNLTRPDEKS
jgi:hypothetical protein